MKTKGGGDSTASMKKWGISHRKSYSLRDGTVPSPQMALLERLVWVKYQRLWWPALLYQSYSELQEQVYKEMDMVLKAQFAMAILTNNKERRNIKIAKLLGRPGLEVVEVDAEGYCEFYWQLPNVLPEACKIGNYGNNLELYFDFHRALDQVEDLIEEVSQENFALLPGSGSYTWLERAKIALNGDGDSASVGGTRLSSRTPQSSEEVRVAVNGSIYRPWTTSESLSKHDPQKNDSIISKIGEETLHQDQQHGNYHDVQTSDSMPSSLSKGKYASVTNHQRHTGTSGSDAIMSSTSVPQRQHQNTAFSGESIASSVSKGSAASIIESGSNPYRHGCFQRHGLVTQRSGTTTSSQAATEVVKNREPSSTRIGLYPHYGENREQSDNNHRSQSGRGIRDQPNDSMARGDPIGQKDSTTTGNQRHYENPYYNHHVSPSRSNRVPLSYQGNFAGHIEGEPSAPPVESRTRTSHRQRHDEPLTSSTKSKRCHPTQRRPEAQQDEAPGSSIIPSVDKATPHQSPHHQNGSSNSSVVRNRGYPRHEDPSNGGHLEYHDNHLEREGILAMKNPSADLPHHFQDEHMSSSIHLGNRPMNHHHRHLLHDEAVISTTVNPGWSQAQGDLVVKDVLKEDQSESSLFTGTKMMGDQSLMGTTLSSTDPVDKSDSSCWGRCLCS